MIQTTEKWSPLCSYPPRLYARDTCGRAYTGRSAARATTAKQPKHAFAAPGGKDMILPVRAASRLHKMHCRII